MSNFGSRQKPELMFAIT